MARACQAFGKNGHPCRGYGRETVTDLVLCHKHTHFYDQPDTAYEMAKRHASIFQTEQHRGWMVRMLRTAAEEFGPAFGNFCRLQLETTWLQNEAMDHAYPGWYNRDRSIYLYGLCLRAELFLPTAIQPFWLRSIRKSLQVLSVTSNTDNLPLTYKGIIRILLGHLVKGLSWETVLAVFVLHICATIGIEGISLAHQIQMWRSILEVTLPLTELRSIVGNHPKEILEDEIQDFLRTPGLLPMPAPLQAVFLEQLEAAQAQQRALLRARTNLFKEELVAAAFSPARVQAALDAGLNPEDL